MNRKFFRFLAVALFAGLALTAVSAGVFANVGVQSLPSEINQENAAAASWSDDASSVGQTFTVDKDGTLDKVQAPLSAGRIIPSQVEASDLPSWGMYAFVMIGAVTDAGELDESIPPLAYSNAVLLDELSVGAAEASASDWYTFELTNPIDVQAGTQYAMVIVSFIAPTMEPAAVDPSLYIPGVIEFQYTDDVYAGGTILTSNNLDAEVVSAFMGLESDADHDLLFTAWVTPAVNPVVFNAGDHGKLNTDQAQVTDIVAYGAAAAVPTVNVDSGYKFLGWVKTSDMTTAVTDFSNITSPLEVTALYEKLPELPKTGEGVMLISGLATLALGGGLVAFRRK